MTHAKTAKVHIAGPLQGSVQKCIRCHVRLDSNDKWPNVTPVGWKPGPVIADRYGMSTATIEEAASIRPCGRKQRGQQAGGMHAPQGKA